MRQFKKDPQAALREVETRPDGDGIAYKIGDYWCSENDVCHGCLDDRLAAGQTPNEAHVQHCGGIYAGKYCDECFGRKFKKDWQHDYYDAGEYLEAEDY
jgi:hypothetical protein